MKIYLAADHNGFDMKRHLAAFLRRKGFDVADEGGQRLDMADDFPQFAARAVAAMKASDDAEPRGILICGSGQGMCMAANRYKGIRASLCWDAHEAHAARNDDDSNVLCLPARFITSEQAEAIATTWLDTPFAAASRFKRRIKQMDDLG